MSIEQRLAKGIAVMRERWVPGAQLCGDESWLYLRLPNDIRCRLLLVGPEALHLVEPFLAEQRILRLADPPLRGLQSPAERRAEYLREKQKLTFEDVWARRSA